MKKAIQATITFIFLLNSLHSQCIVDAGLNRNLCQDEILNSPTLNGEIISGDVVEVSWHSEYYEASLDQYYYASSMLNDTSVLQPIIEQHFERTVQYYLTGTTVDKQTCVDSVELNFSDWLYLTIDKRTGKAPSDTIELWIAAQSNWDHIKYEWSPNYMISDTTVEKPLVWNDTTVFYNLEITDELNCTVTDDIFEVYTNSSSVNRIATTDFRIYPNPSQGLIHIKSPEEVETVEVFDLRGRFLKKTKSASIDLTGFSPGQYVIKVQFSNQSIGTRLVHVDE